MHQSPIQHAEAKDDVHQSSSQSSESNHEDNNQSLQPVQADGGDEPMAIEAKPENPEVDPDLGGA